jgi:hypothetical protein
VERLLARGDSGNDTLVNPTNLDLDDVYQGEFTFEGGTGTDTVVADNSNDTTVPYSMFLKGTSLGKQGFAVQYDDCRDRVRQRQRKSKPCAARSRCGSLVGRG